MSCLNRPDKWWKYLIPTYGRWGGAGWSGGKWVNDPKETGWGIKPKDEMDKLFKEHDYYYQHCKNFTNIADINLLIGLKELKIDGFYKNAYRMCAIVAFIMKIMFTSLLKK